MISNKQFIFSGEKYALHASFWENEMAHSKEPFILKGDLSCKSAIGDASESFAQSQPGRALLWRYAGERPMENYILWASAIAVVLSKYTGTNRVVFQTPLVNRNTEEPIWEKTVPVFLEVAESNSLKETILQVGARVKDFYRYQNFPLDMLQVPEQAFVDPALITNIRVVYKSVHLEFTETNPDSGFFHIVINPADEQENVSFQINYDSGAYSGRFVRQFGQHLLCILEQFRDLNQVVADCSMLSEAETRQLLIEFNDTALPYPKDKTVLDLIGSRAAFQPQKTAFVFEDRQLTYQELWEQSNQLAHYLVKANVREGDLVAVCLDRSLEMITILLGILKAGAAYVPIDPDYPQERIHYLLEDMGTKLAIAHKIHLALLSSEQPEITLVAVEDIWPALKSEPGNRMPVQVTPNHLAYVIYTSGSTGKPKGVMIGHRSLLVRLTGMTGVLDIDEHVKTCLWTNYVFDVSLLESLLPLIAGASIQIPDKEDIYDTDRLIDLYIRARVTHIQVTPSFLTNFTSALTASKAKALSLEKICSGGESLKKEQVTALQKKLPGIKINNHYGPTEATIDATSLRDLVEYETNWIGKPLPNTQVYIVDSANRLVPTGVAGELLIGGDTLAVGYLNRKALTEEKFIQNPFSIDPAARLYKTGDLARWLPDGNLEFLGRIDEQVKIRGFRIELGEIESVLSGYEAVKACAVKAVADAQGEIRLAAYIVPAQSYDKSALQHFLNANLPEYMMPAAWVELAEMPVNSNGKTDKKALPAPDFSAQSTREYTAPQNEWERMLADIWKSLLHLEKVSVYDNFFELGGHSLLVMTLMSKVYHQTQIKISLPEVFLNPELAALAAVVAAKTPEVFEAIPVADSTVGNGLYPLSDAQMQIWVIEQQQEKSVGFILPDFFRLSGQLNIDHFRTAYENIIRRHDSLRTVFRKVGNQPFQFVKAFSEQDTWMEYEDLRQMEDRLAWVEKKARSEEQNSFDLANGPLIRMKLYRLEASEYVMLMTAHHIVTDLQSTLLVFKELIQGYNALVKNRQFELKPLPIQYKDYAVWQLNKKANTLHKAYWLREFEGFVGNQLLAPDFPRPKIKSYRGSTIYFRIDPLQTAQLLDFCHRKGMSLYMIFYSILNFLLYRYTDQTDITIGSAVSEREHTDLEAQIGLFVNILAFRNQLQPEATFGEFLEANKYKVLEGYKHQSFSFYELVNSLQLPRVSNRNPLFDIYLSVGVESLNQLGLDPFDQINMEPFLLDDTKSMHDLSVNFSQKDDYIEGALTYPTALFRQEKIEGLRDHILNVLSLITSHETTLQHTPLSEISYLSEGEKQKLLSFHSNEASFPADKTVVDLFEAQAAKWPDKVALVFEGRELSYRELNEQVNRLAHCLKAKGIKTESPVAICMERSMEMIIGILAILKSSGAYVPIDPGYPQERINFMLEDCGYAALIDARFYEDFKLNEGNYPVLNLSAKPNPDNLYSIIYTSGSTGKPKGVLLEHRGLVNHIHNVKKHYQVNETSRFLQFFNIGFDAAAEEIFTSLCFGASLHIRSEDELDPFRMLDLINQSRITHADFSTAYFESFITSISPFSLREKLVSCGIGGEKVNRSFIVKNKAHLSAFTHRLFNVYGPTETTLTVTIFNILEDPSFEERLNIPIGTPYPNRSIVLLDTKGNLVPPGVYGELHIGGVGISRGYLNRPGLTLEKFIPHPYPQVEGQKLYKTGDLACWLPDGNIDYLGRTDSQVKIRGYRIELGEIENKLKAHAQVEDAVVICREQAASGKELVAYYVPSIKEPGADKRAKGDQVLRKAIKAYLKAELPEYMVPALFVEVAAFPLTRNGKVDKNALPKPDVSEFIENEYIPPRNRVEEMLASVWRELLGIQKIGINDNFYELGGDSIKALQVSSKLYKTGFAVDVKDIFLHQTIGAIATHIEAVSRIPDQMPVIGLVPLTAIQKTFFDWKLKNPNHFNQAILLTCPDHIPLAAIESILTKLQIHHDMLRARFEKQEDGQLIQVCTPPDTPIALQSFDLSGLDYPASEIERIAQKAQKSLSLEHQLWASVHFKLPSSERLLIVVHHLIVDGISWRILLEDLSALFFQHAEKTSPDLPFKSDAFKVWAEQMTDYAQSERLLAEKNYWRTVEATQVMSLSREKETPGNCYRDEANEAFELNETGTRHLISNVHQALQTDINDLLLAALSVAVSQTFGLNKLAIALEGHGREDIFEQVNIKRTIGWFTSLFPIVLEHSPSVDLRAHIKKTRDALRGIPNRGIGYGILKYLAPDELKEDLTFNLAPQISFNYLGQIDSDFDEQVFKIAPEPVGEAVDGDNHRIYELEISGMISEKKLRMGITYNAKHFHQETIQKLANQYLIALETCIDCCLMQPREEIQADDFTTKNISKVNLNKLNRIFS